MRYVDMVGCGDTPSTTTAERSTFVQTKTRTLSSRDAIREPHGGASGGYLLRMASQTQSFWFARSRASIRNIS